MKKLCFYISTVVIVLTLNSCRTDEELSTSKPEAITKTKIFEINFKNDGSTNLYARDSTATAKDSIDNTNELETDPVIPPKK